ncbi:uncharacterized protein [Porites lutea]|uniref:uncharacterized protein isoform X2 n=1 Tax=Porites lutea TaxID=51062 RepID=UPI003CC61762
MASNGLMFRAGRGPSFILVGLVVVVIILFYSYWGVSSKNNKLLRDVSVLQDRLRVLAARKLTSDKKSSALVTQLTQLQGEKDKVDVDLKTKDSQVSDVKMRLKEKEQELAALLAKEKFYNEELAKLRQGMNSSSSALKVLKGKGALLLKKFEQIKANYSALLEKISKLTEERDNCKEDLSRMKLELEKEKKAKVTEASRVTNKASTKSMLSKKTTGRKEIGSEDAGEEKNSKDSEAGKEEKPTLSTVKGNISKEARNTSSPKNISSEVQGAIGQDRNKSRSYESSELKTKNQSMSLTSNRASAEDESEAKKIKKEDKSDDQDNVGDENEGDKDNAREKPADKKEEEDAAAGDNAENAGEEEGGDNEENEGEEEILDDEKEVEEGLGEPNNRMVLPRPKGLSQPGLQDEGRAVRSRILRDKKIPGRLAPGRLSRDQQVEEGDEI